MKLGRKGFWIKFAQVSAVLLTLVIGGAFAFPQQFNSIPGLFDIKEKPYKLGLDLQGGAYLVYNADMKSIPQADRVSALQGVRDVIERRVNAFGVSEPLVQTNQSGDAYRLIVELAGVFDVQKAIDSIGETPILEFKIPVKDVKTDVTPEQKQQIAAAQKAEKTDAEKVLARAKTENFGALAKEVSIDAKTKDNNGYIGWIESTDKTFDGLAAEIKAKKYKLGIIPGAYESTSALHIVNYLNYKEITEAQLSHILVCYKGAEGCKSERSQTEAQVLAGDLQKKATAKNFAELAKTNSDDTGSAANDGSLGWVREGAMIAPFEDAYKALKNGRISSVVETKYGYHIIYRAASRQIPQYEIAHIEMPWTTASDVIQVDPWENTQLSGKYVKHASVAFDPNTNEPYVTLEFNSEGGDIFGKLTEAHVNDVIGIFLDGKAISTPVVQQAIYGGKATITGHFNIVEAKQLAQRLNAGALPVPIELISQRTVGPTLGLTSLENSVRAAMIGFLLVALFMILYYRFAGLIAVVALTIYVVLNMIFYKLFGITMTLSGIAGFVLSLGIAVDANVLIFERMREELRAGRDLRTAIDEGVRRAWTSIRDGNATTLVAAFVLFSFSTSFIKGFALTLGLGVLLSLFTAIVVSRSLLHWFSDIEAFQKKWLYMKNK